MTTIIDHNPPITDLNPALLRLMAEPAGKFPVQTVRECLSRCYFELRRDGVAAGLDDAAEAMARIRLRLLTRDATDVLGPAAVPEAVAGVA